MHLKDEIFCVYMQLLNTSLCLIPKRNTPLTNILKHLIASNPITGFRQSSIRNGILKDLNAAVLNKTNLLQLLSYSR